MFLFLSVIIAGKVHRTNNTNKKEKKIFLIYEEIQMGSGAKSYMRKAPNTNSI
jgi:hypothetical protein